MKITPELVNRYHSNRCTVQEAEAVQAWLLSGEIEDSLPEPEQADAWLELTWTKIAAKIDLSLAKEETPVVPFYKKLIRYASAACVLLAILMGGYFFLQQDKKPLANKEKADALLVSTAGYKPVSITDNSCKIKFKGHLQLTNNSSEIKTIVCEDKTMKTFQLQPGESYYLEALNGTPCLVNQKEMWEEYPYNRGSFTIHLKKV